MEGGEGGGFTSGSVRKNLTQRPFQIGELKRLVRNQGSEDFKLHRTEGLKSDYQANNARWKERGY